MKTQLFLKVLVVELVLTDTRSPSIRVHACGGQVRNGVLVHVHLILV